MNLTIKKSFNNLSLSYNAENNHDNFEIKFNNLKEKIKAILFSIGINEKYVAFDYLADILEFIITKKLDIITYNNALIVVAEKYSVTFRTAKQSLSKVLKMCVKPEIKNSLQFNLKTNSIFNKINIIKCYAEMILAKSTD